MYKKRFYFSKFLFTIICIFLFIKTQKEMQKLVYNFFDKKEKNTFEEIKKFEIRKNNFFKSNIEEKSLEKIDELKEELKKNVEENILNDKIFYIQIGIFFKKDNALKIQKKLGDISSFIEEGNLGDKKIYKLISEDVEGTEKADDLIKKIHKKLNNNERLIKRLRGNLNGEGSKH